ncbi:hypothetical protein GE09DRAFT_1117126 [Coniochaeta sp. 2T2.1]|nr:hypothetical protein GE09DRAFT_1117126 [Coniochaeta sp. 2T2.1]
MGWFVGRLRYLFLFMCVLFRDGRSGRCSCMNFLYIDFQTASGDVGLFRPRGVEIICLHNLFQLTKFHCLHNFNLLPRTGKRKQPLRIIMRQT